MVVVTMSAVVTGEGVKTLDDVDGVVLPEGISSPVDTIDVAAKTVGVLADPMSTGLSDELASTDAVVNGRLVSAVAEDSTTSLLVVIEDSTVVLVTSMPVESDGVVELATEVPLATGMGDGEENVPL